MGNFLDNVSRFKAAVKGAWGVPPRTFLVYNGKNASKSKEEPSMIQFGLRLHDAEKLPIEQVLPLVRQRGFWIFLLQILILVL